MKTIFCSLLAGSFLFPAMIWAQTPYVTDANTLFLYHLDETSGTTATDSSGNGRHATYGSAVTINLPSQPGLDTSIKGANNLSGRTTWKDTANPDGQDSFLYHLTEGSFTVEAWVRLDEDFDYETNRMIVVIQPDGQALADFSFSIRRRSSDDGGTYHLAVGDKNGPNRAWSFNTPLDWELGEWYHVAVTGTPTGTPGQWNYKFYNNQVGDSVTPTAIHSSNNTMLAPRDTLTQLRTLEIGNYYGGSGLGYLPGQIDEVRISNIARTQFDTLAVIPEPSSLLLWGVGIGCIALRRRRN